MKVSILIPVYNSANFLSKTIDSALKQTWSDKEIIVVDDGSTDNSLQIAKSFAEINNNVKVFTQTNGGACKARNKAFAESTGVYIQYLDADDILSHDKIQHQMDQISQVDESTVFSCPWIRFYRDEEIEYIKPSKQFLDKDWSAPIDWLVNAWEGKGMAQTSVWLTPRHLIEKAGEWNERLSVNQDGEFFCRVLLNASAIKFTDKSTVYYRSGNENSVSQKKNKKKIADLLLSYRLFAENTLTKYNTERVKQALAVNYLSFFYLYNNQFPELAKQVWDYMNELNISKYPLVGGKVFKIVSRVIGFNNSLKIKSIFNTIV